MKTAVSFNPETTFHFHLTETQQATSTKTHLEAQLMQKAEQFKSAVFKSLENEIKRKKEAPQAFALAIAHSLADLTNTMHEILGDHTPLSTEEKNALGAAVRREVIPSLMFANIPFRTYTKPRGYAGDFETIADFYADEAKGINETGKILDQIFLNNIEL